MSEARSARTFHGGSSSLDLVDLSPGSFRRLRGAFLGGHDLAVLGHGQDFAVGRRHRLQRRLGLFQLEAQLAGSASQLFFQPVAHLFGVMSLVAEGGGDEDQLVAALLHDWLEDIPGATADMLEHRFGHRVRWMVEALSDSTVHPKSAWQPRKEAYIATLAAKPADIKLVSAADKLHTAQTLVRDLRVEGLDTFDRFSGGVRGTVWYYAEVAAAF